MRNSKSRKIKNKIIIGILFSCMPAIFIIVLIMVVSSFMINSGSPQMLVQMLEINDKTLKDASKIYADTGVDWMDLLATYAVEYNGDWEDYSRGKLKGISGEIERIKEDDQETFKFYRDLYADIYGDLIDYYTTSSEDGEEKSIHYYYDAYFPIARGSSIAYSNDFMDERSFGDITYHDGNDILCDEGTPIIAVEGGEVETIGWNAAGGWRVGIRSGDRFWYYAHMRKVHPYYKKLSKGDYVSAGQLIGYVGSTGYSDAIPNDVMPRKNSLTYPGAVDRNMVEHLHIGLQVKLRYGEDEEDIIEEWVNPYPILRFLEDVKVRVKKETVTKYRDGEEYEEETGDYIAEELEKEDRVFDTHTLNKN